MDAFENPNHSGNSDKYHTGKTCIEKGCEKPAGTAWGLFWCFEHNVKRMGGITKKLEEITQERRQ